MAATAEAARLTEAHRLAQIRLGAGVVARMHAAWRLLDVEDLDGTFPSWHEVVTALVQVSRRNSATLAANYLATFRALELGLGTALNPVLAEAVNARALATSMLVTGPVSIRSALARGVSLEQAARTAEGRTAGAAMRHALDGGRQTLVRTTSSDRRALGWARATSGSPCAFCAMLASRGPVYGADAVDFKTHDHCSCVPEPVYRDDAAWPAGSRRLRELWDETTADTGGVDELTAFRRALGGR